MTTLLSAEYRIPLNANSDFPKYVMTAVKCDTHGVQPRTFVCQHIVEGLLQRQRLGFFWTAHDPENSRPDAWCAACNRRVGLTDGEWTVQALELLQPKVLCGACYDVAKLFHMGGDPWA
jgi:hypothetical protein